MSNGKTNYVVYSIFSKSIGTYCIVLLLLTTILISNRIRVRTGKFKWSLLEALFNYDDTWEFQRSPNISTSELSELRRKLINATDKKVILVWYSMFGQEFPIPINETNCGNCEVTFDRSRISDPSTAAVVFHFDDISVSSMPEKRNLNQLHIFWAMEAPPSFIIRKVTLDFEESYGFNATMTHRRDADFCDSYMNIVTPSEIIEKNTLSLHSLLRMKSKMALAVVSNCNTVPGAVTRYEKIISLLETRLDLDAYGSCFGGNNFAEGKHRRTTKFRGEVRKYKFYIAFENSYHCKDYISEKLFLNALSTLTVPVVWGATREDYEAVAPPGSFIFAEDFPSEIDLADHLNYLDKNDHEYLKYLRWLEMKPEEMPQYGRPGSFCAICRAVHGINIDDKYNPKYNASNPPRPTFTDGVARRTIPSIKKWFFGEENEACFS